MAWHIEDIDHHKTGVGWHFCLVFWFSWKREGVVSVQSSLGRVGWLPTKPAFVCYEAWRTRNMGYLWIAQTPTYIV